MILLDTNIVSEFMGARPHPSVLAWLKTLPVSEIGITAIQTAEIMKGLSSLPDGRRKDSLFRDYRSFRANLPDANVLPFDEAAALEFGNIVSHRSLTGRPIKEMDAQIAAIAVVHGYPLATRNIGDFEDCGITLINPFTYKV